MMKVLVSSPGVLVALTMVRASISSSTFIVGPGRPGGVRLPWGKLEVGSRTRKEITRRPRRRCGGIFIGPDFENNLPSYGAGLFPVRVEPAALMFWGPLLETARQKATTPKRLLMPLLPLDDAVQLLVL